VLVLYRGQVLPEKGDSLPTGITIVVANKYTNEVIGTYRPQRNGNFTAILKPKNVYIFSYQLDGKEFFREEIVAPDNLSYQEIERAIPLKPVKVVPIENANPEIKPTGITLNVKVMDLKTFLPYKGAKIHVTDNKGLSFYFFSDSTGNKNGIDVEAGKEYILDARIGEFPGEAITFSTVGLKTGKKINKTIYASFSKETYNVDSLVNGVFIHYFEFNQTDIEHYHNYPQFLTEIDSMLAKNGKITIKIKASASHVPTKAKGGLSGLAKSRAETLKAKVMEYLFSEGIDLKKVKFEIVCTVGGPAYTKDFLRHIREYEKFQFVEAKVK
jgi:hypothetical protein